MRRLPAAVLACALVACGGGSTPEQTKSRKDAGTAGDAEVTVTVDARPLGLPDVASFGWRKRGGHPAFRVARQAEATSDWAAVVTTCRQALAADPSHLEASWLLAAALGHLGKHDEILAPLQLAVAGDFGKWGAASLELPSLQAFLATPRGQAWSRRVEQDRSLYIAALARSVIVTAHGDLFAFDLQTTRWHRLTRTYGAVVGSLRAGSAQRIVYVTRQRVKRHGKKETLVAVGGIDLGKGRTTKAVDVGGAGPITVAYATKTNPGVWIGAGVKGGPKPITWRRIDDNHQLVALPPKTARPPGAYLEVTGRTPRLRALPVPDVTADWDVHGLASAIRLAKSNRVISVPSPGMIDGNTATWSPDRARLAFVAQLADQCAPDAINAAAFVVDATTGQLQELERGAELAVEWATDRKLVVAGDRGVVIRDLDNGPPLALEEAEGLLAPRRRPTCSPPEPDDLLIPDEPEPQEPSGLATPSSP